MVAALELAQIDARAVDFEPRFARLESRRTIEREQLQERVAGIVADVRRRGDLALLDAIERFDGYRLRADELALRDDEIAAGAARIGSRDADALRTAAERIRRFHGLRVPHGFQESGDDERLGQLVRPLARVGLYVPGGTAPLASTTLMLGIPAAVAGVRERVMCSPGRELHPAVLAASRLAGVTRLYRIGGAQAIAALAYGTESVTRVDKIVGPGNSYVQEAKRQVFGNVAIDAEAGPSEVFIVADETARADFLAADLLAQAEHDELASVVLATPSAVQTRAVYAELDRQVGGLAREKIARSALAGRSALIVTRDLAQACELANRYAPEHLQLCVADQDACLARIDCAGAIFLGPYSPVPIGDYVAGPSHVLPTGGTARFFSVVGVEDFQRRTSLIELGAEAYRRVAPAAICLARLEGLDAHARALEIRLKETKEP